jgi:hypothetical protein
MDPHGDGGETMGERLSGPTRSCRATEGQRPRMEAAWEMEDLLHTFVSSASSCPAKVAFRSDPLAMSTLDKYYLPK